jgi:hypothetical protein
MIDLGTTSFWLDAPVMSRDHFEVYSTRLFDEWDARLTAKLTLSDYSLALELEEGSVEGAGTVKVVIGTLLGGVVAYGGFVNGIQIIGKQVRAAGDYLAKRAAAPFTTLNLKPRVRRRSGTLGQLQRLFVSVQQRELSIEEAIREAEVILGQEAMESPEFMKMLSDALKGIRQDPEQLLLPMPLPEELQAASPTDKRPSARERKKAVVQPERQHWRVEMWRESKTGKREMRIVEL